MSRVSRRQGDRRSNRRLPLPQESVLQEFRWQRHQGPLWPLAASRSSVYPWGELLAAERPISAAARWSSIPSRRWAKPPSTKPPLRLLSQWMRVLQIRAPSRVGFCVRRKVRKEVLFAKRVAGRRGLGRRGVRFTQDSQYRC